MVIDEKEVAEEISKELDIPLEKVIELTSGYKESIKVAIREFKKNPKADFKILMPHLLTFKHK